MVRLSLYFLLFLLFLLLMTRIVSASPQWTSITLASRGGNPQAMAEVRYRRLNNLPAFALGSPGNFSEPWANLLVEYYHSLWRGQVSVLGLMFADVDGSRGRIVSSLQRQPDQFDGYAALREVTFLYEFLWGPYHLIGVFLEGDRRRLPWREDVLCLASSCFLSNAMDNDQAEEILAEAVFYGILSNGPAGMSLNRLLDFQQNAQVMEVFPAFDRGRENPIRIYLDLHLPSQEAGERVFDFSEAPLVGSDEQTGFLLEALREIRDADQTALETVLAEVWHSDRNPDIVAAGVLLNRADRDGAPRLVNYSWGAFLDLLKGWESVEIVGGLDVGGVRLIYVEPRTGEGRQEAVQVFAVASREGGFVVTEPGELGFAGLVLRSPLVLNFVQNAL